MEMSSDIIDGVEIRSCALSTHFISACRRGDADAVASILRTCRHSRSGDHGLDAKCLTSALLEGVAWSRVEVVRKLLDAGAPINARGGVWTPGGSGVSNEDTKNISASELCHMMVAAGLRPRRAQQISGLIACRRRTLAGSTDDDEDSDDAFRCSKRARRASSRFEKQAEGGGNRPGGGVGASKRRRGDDTSAALLALETNALHEAEQSAVVAPASPTPTIVDDEDVGYIAHDAVDPLPNDDDEEEELAFSRGPRDVPSARAFVGLAGARESTSESPFQRATRSFETEVAELKSQVARQGGEIAELREMLRVVYRAGIAAASVLVAANDTGAGTGIPSSGAARR